MAAAPPRRRRRRTLLVLLALPLVVALVVVVGAQVLVWQQSRGRLHDNPSTLPPTEVGLVLGASVEPSGDPSPFLEARLAVAAELVTSGTVQRLIVSGDNRSADYDEPAAMKRWLVERGVPAEAITEDGGGIDTHASCVRAREVYGVDQLVVITQGYHLPRAVATCRLVGVDAVGVADQSARQFPSTWAYGERREWLANVKLLLDLV